MARVSKSTSSASPKKTSAPKQSKEQKAALKAQQAAEKKARAAADKAAKAAAKLQAKADAKAAEDRLKNTREYPELTGLLSTAPYKTLATLNWFNDHLPTGEPPLGKLVKKEKDRFVLATVRSGTAAAVIAELRNTPARRWKEFLGELARVRSEKSAAERISALSPKDFAAFCEANEIAVVRAGAKATVSKPKTMPLALARLAEHREFLKL